MRTKSQNFSLVRDMWTDQVVEEMENSTKRIILSLLFRMCIKYLLL